MPIRKLWGLVPVAAMLVGGLLMFLIMPARTAHACLPCACDFNPTLNCHGTYAAYTHGETAEECEIEIGKISGRGYEELAISLTAEELAALPEFPEENMLIGEYYEIALYKLTSGEYQINAGPDVESKVNVLNWYGCPAENVRESNFTISQ